MLKFAIILLAVLVSFSSLVTANSLPPLPPLEQQKSEEKELVENSPSIFEKIKNFFWSSDQAKPVTTTNADTKSEEDSAKQNNMILSSPNDQDVAKLPAPREEKSDLSKDAELPLTTVPSDGRLNEPNIPSSATNREAKVSPEIFSNSVPNSVLGSAAVAPLSQLPSDNNQAANEVKPAESDKLPILESANPIAKDKVENAEKNSTISDKDFDLDKFTLPNKADSISANSDLVNSGTPSNLRDPNGLESTVPNKIDIPSEIVQDPNSQTVDGSISKPPQQATPQNTIPSNSQVIIDSQNSQNKPAEITSGVQSSAAQNIPVVPAVPQDKTVVAPTQPTPKLEEIVKPQQSNGASDQNSVKPQTVSAGKPTELPNVDMLPTKDQQSPANNSNKIIADQTETNKNAEKQLPPATGIKVSPASKLAPGQNNKGIKPAPKRTADSSQKAIPRNREVTNSLKTSKAKAGTSRSIGADKNSGAINDEPEDRFVINETIMLGIDDEDVILGEVNADAAEDLLDFDAYIKKFWISFEKQQSMDRKQKTASFLKDYDNKFYGYGSLPFINQNNYNYLNAEMPLYEHDLQQDVLSATVKGDLNSLRVWLDNYPLLNTCDADGNSLLSIAVANGHNEVVKYLLEKGIEYRSVNNANMTAQDIAKLQNNTYILNLLQSIRLSQPLKIKRNNAAR